VFKDLHPSGSAGDGKQIPTATYSYPTDKPDHHLKCALCGFQFDADVNQQGDTLLSPGISYAAPETQTVNLPVPAGAAPISYTETIVEPSVVGGCPFCGSFNPTGELIGVPFDSGVDISNQ
jgi:hypothetical protein